jgi:magnesium chelatase family protein
MLARVQSYLLQGIDALACEVEVDLDESGIEKQIVVGLPDAGVKESLERVRSAMTNAGYWFPGGRLLINLAPADVRKEGPLYDLPIAVGVLVAAGMIKMPAPAETGGPEPRAGAGGSSEAGTQPSLALRARSEGAAPGLDPRRYMFAGELALDGRVRPIRGVIALASLAKQRGMTGVVVPMDNAPEAAVVPGVEVVGVRTLTEVVGLLTGHIEPSPMPPVDIERLLTTVEAPVDFAEVRGQEAVKRAITIAASGSHNLFRL